MYEELEKILPQMERDVPDMALNAAKFIRAARNLLTENGELRSQLAAKDAEIERLTTERDGYKGTLRSANQTNAALGKKLVEVAAERDAAVTAFESAAHSGGNLCEFCGADCIDAGFDDPDNFQCGAFKWRTPAKQDEEG